MMPVSFSFTRWIERRGVSFTLKCIALLLFCGFVIMIISVQLSLDMLKRDNDCSSQLLHSKEIADSGIFLVILLLTAPGNVEQRTVVRTTWLSNIPAGVKVFFAVGTKNLDVQKLSSLTSENRQYQDILLLSHVEDSYKGLTEKLIESLKWIYDNVKFTFLFKGDDDTFVRLDLLEKELRHRTPERIYWGFFDGRAHVKRKGQWAEPNWILCDRYLPHARGGGYILSADLVEYIVKNAPLLQRFNSEDISVGAWLGPLDVHRLHDLRFDTEYVSRGCSNSYIVTHKQTGEMMRVKQKSLQENGQLCEKQFQSRQSYIYNWEVHPSLCCVRNTSDVS